MPLAVAVKPDNAGVTTNFESVPDYASAKQSLLSQVAADQPVAISLEEVICLAAKNSELADTIEQERHLLKCRVNDLSEVDDGRSAGCSKTCPSRRGRGLDLILQGESLEQRNLAASKAAQAFLGLTQVSLQQELIDESRQRLAELEETVAAADEAGFATAEGYASLKKGQLQLDRLESTVAAAQQELNYQLNMLINVGDQQAVIFRPVHDLNPQPVNLDVLQETALAETNRPGIIAAETVISNRGDGEGLYRLLSMFDARIGQQLNARPIKKQLLRRQLIELIKATEQPDSTLSQRRGQAEKIVTLRKREARLAAGKAMLDMQTAFEKLAIAHSDIQRLDEQAKLIDAAQEVDSKDAYLKSNENWVEQLEARAERIEAAIELEIAKVKLQQSQGLLAEPCVDSIVLNTCD